jgi:hypothetical protein
MEVVINILLIVMVISGIYISKKRDPLFSAIMNFPEIYIYAMKSFWKQAEKLLRITRSKIQGFPGHKKWCNGLFFFENRTVPH